MTIWLEYAVRSTMVLRGGFSKFNFSSWPSLYYVHVSDATYEKIDRVCHDVETVTDSAHAMLLWSFCHPDSSSDVHPSPAVVPQNTYHV